MGKNNSWESSTDSMIATETTTKSRNTKMLALIAGGIALAGAGLALTKGRKMRKSKKK